MEVIIIDESRVKLMLTPEDMALYRVSAGGIDTKEVLRGIMRDAREKCGYRGMKGRIYIQMYPSREGGCELFVTKLAERENGTDMKLGNEGILTEYRKYIFRGRVIYSFESMRDLLGACLGLTDAGYCGESAAYIDKSQKTYYLLLECESHIAGENLGSLCQSSAYYYINEHCAMICSDAVAKLGKLA